MATASEIINECLERYEDLKPYILFCNPTNEEEIKKCTGEKIRVIANSAVQKEMVYLMKKTDLEWKGEEDGDKRNQETDCH